MIFKKIILSVFCLVCSAQSLLVGLPAWTAPLNNQIPLGTSTGIVAFGPAIAFPSSGQIVQTWIDVSDRIYYASYDGVSWSAPGDNVIPLGASTSIVASPFPAYDPGSGQIVQIWQDGGNNRLYYATYDGTSWTALANNEIPLGAASGVYVGGFNTPSYSTELVLVWLEELNGSLYYATYDGTSWSVPANNEIPLGVSTGSHQFLDLAYDSTANQLMQVWRDRINTNLIYYATFDGTGWSVPANNQLPTGASSGVSAGGANSPFYDNGSDQILELWQNGNLFFASYDGTGWSVPANNQIPLGASSGVGEGGYTNFVLDQTSNQVVEAWQDSVNSNLYYATYNGVSWSATADNQLPLGSSSGVSGYTDPIYDNALSQLVQVWQDASSNLFFYATYNGANWSAIANNQIPLGASTAVNFGWDPIYLDPVPAQLVQVWQDSSNSRLYYAFYEYEQPSAPISFSGQAINNRLLLQKDLIYKLTWAPTADPTVVSYLLSRNGTLIYTAPAAGPYVFLDHNRNKNEKDVYTLTSQDVNGVISAPLTVSF